MNIKSGCLICDKELKYSEKEKPLECSICHKSFQSNTSCIYNHFVCDNCHSTDALDYIEKVCVNTKTTDPFLLSNSLMSSNLVNMHGPEHHFLVPAILITVFCNSQNKEEDYKEKSLSTAKERAKTIPGGICGLHGSCGAGIGTGILISVILKATPLSEKEWELANLMTSRSLASIAKNGGPRCCKRDSFLAINEGLKFLKDFLDVDIKNHFEDIKCKFYKNNRQCLGKRCDFF